MKKVSLKGVTAELDPITAGIVLKSTDRRLKGKPFKVTLAADSGSYSSILNILKDAGAVTTGANIRPSYRFYNVEQLEVPGRDPRCSIHLGKGIQDKDINLDLSEAPTVLFSGVAGSGKTVGVNNVLAYGLSRAEVKLAVIDLTKIELNFTPRQHDLRATDLDGALRTLGSVHRELRSRNDLLSSLGMNDYSATGLPAIYLILDGIRWDSQYAQGLKPMLREILHSGRSLGIYTFISSQDGLEGELLAATSTTILFGSNSSETAHRILTRRLEIGSALLKNRGRAIIQTHGKQELVQIGFMPQEVRKEVGLL